MDSGLTGFDPGKVYSCIGQIGAGRDEFFKVLYNDTQNKFVNPMGDCWACKEAQEYFTTFKAADDELIDKIINTFNTIHETVKKAAEAWARDTGTSISIGNFTVNPNRISIDCIKENFNGSRGIDKGAAQDAIEQFKQLTTQIESAKNRVNKAVKDSGFIGGEQQYNLQMALRSICEAINSKFDDLMQEATIAINQTAEAYGELEQDVSNAFEIDANDIDFSKISTNANDAANGNFIDESNIHKDYWGDSTGGKLEAEIRDDGTVLIKEDGVAMGYTTKEALGIENASQPEQNNLGESTPTSNNSDGDQIHYDNWDTNHEYGYTSQNNSTSSTSTSANSSGNNADITQIETTTSQQSTDSSIDWRPSYQRDLSPSGSSTSNLFTHKSGKF